MTTLSTALFNHSALLALLYHITTVVLLYTNLDVDGLRHRWLAT